MVGSGINGVGADDVGVELREKGHVLLAASLVGEGVDDGRVLGGGARGAGVLLVRDALEEELCAIWEEELGALRVTIGVVSRDS